MCKERPKFQVATVRTLDFDITIANTAVECSFPLYAHGTILCALDAYMYRM